MEKVINITKAVVVLSNFLMATRSPEDTHSYSSLNYTDYESAARRQTREGRRRENTSNTGLNNWNISIINKVQSAGKWIS